MLPRDAMHNRRIYLFIMQNRTRSTTHTHTKKNIKLKIKND